MIRYEFLAPLWLAALAEAAYYIYLLRVRFNGEPLESHVGLLALPLKVLMIGGFVSVFSRPTELLADDRLVGPCPLYAIWEPTLCNAELAFTTSAALVVAQTTWHIREGESPKALRMELLAPIVIVFMIAYALSIGPVAYFKSCGDSDDLVFWSLLELVVDGAFCAPGFLLYFLAFMFVSDTLAHRVGKSAVETNHTQFHKQLLRSTKWLAVMGLVPMLSIGAGVVLQVVMLVTPYAQSLHQLVDCVACTIVWTSFTIQRVAIVTFVTRKSADVTRTFDALARHVSAGGLAAMLDDDDA